MQHTVRIYPHSHTWKRRWLLGHAHFAILVPNMHSFPHGTCCLLLEQDILQQNVPRFGCDS
jgi:hypothetical protein